MIEIIEKCKLISLNKYFFANSQLIKFKKNLIISKMIKMKVVEKIMEKIISNNLNKAAIIIVVKEEVVVAKVEILI